MRYGIYCANFGALAEPSTLVDLALAAEAAGWDGFFVYDHVVLIRGRAVRSIDPWTVLAAVAARTGLTLGPLVTPVARRRPWELAHQSIAVDRLSDGRLILGVGLGEPADHEAFGDESSARERGDRLDEGLEILEQLWSGKAVQHTGSWRLNDVALAPGPVYGRIPIWVAGRYGSRRPLRRAARFDGMIPINDVWELDRLLQPKQLEEMISVVRDERGNLDGFEVVVAGVSQLDGTDGAVAVAPYAAAGATWWLEIIEPGRGELNELRARVAAGPPRGPT